MCTSYPPQGVNKSNASTATTPFVVDGVEVKKGTKWVFDSDGREYEVAGVDRKYLFTNGDPDTLYLAVNDVNDPNGKFILTHKRFATEAKAKVDRVERFISLDMIMRNKPCWEGAVWAFYAAEILPGRLAARNLEEGEEDWFRLGRMAEGSNRYKMSKSMSVSKMYEKIEKGMDVVPDPWLLFIAKALDLVPKGMSHMGRKTLLRLLGIKE